MFSSSPGGGHSEFRTDHNIPEQNGRQFFFFYRVAKEPRSVEPGEERPLVRSLLRARVAK